MTVTPHQQIPLTQWKLPETPIISRNTKRKREREGGQLMLISYCVRLIVMTTPLHCLKFIPCKMLSMAELLIKMFIHTTALKLAHNR